MFKLSHCRYFILSTHLLLASPLFCDIQSSLVRAAEARENASYDLAIICYQQVLDDLHESPVSDLELIQHVNLQLAQSYYDAERFRELAEMNDLENSKVLVLRALAYKNLGQPEQAIALLKEHRPDAESSWHLAHAYYSLGDKIQARAGFEQYSVLDHPDLYALSQIYLARLSIDEKKYSEASERLRKLEGLLSGQEPLLYEWHYLLGECAYHGQQLGQAALEYEQALPARNREKVDWSTQTCHRLISCYLALADSQPEQCREYLKNAERHLKNLQELSRNDDVQLALAHYHIIKGRQLNDESALQAAEGILTCTEHFTTPQARSQALLLRAETAASYQERDKLYQQLTDTTSIDTRCHAEGWYLRGLNDLIEGERLLQSNQPHEATPLLESAVHCLTRAFELLLPSDSASAAQAVKHAIKANMRLERDRSQQEALRLATYICQQPDILASAEDPDEFFYLQALLLDQQQATFPEAKSKVTTLLNEQLSLYPKGRFADSALYLLATRFYHNNDIAQAQECYQRLISLYPQSPLVADAYFWQAQCLEKVGDNRTQQRQLLAKVYTDFPQSSIAAEAYYSYYTVPEYLQGDIAAIEHLEKMGERFPNSPLAIQAYLLTGLDYKRTRLSPEGKIVRKRNVHQAIQAYQEAETRFDLLYSQGLILEKDMDTLIGLRYRAILERALANLTIAMSSEGAKKHIYLEYAIEVFERLLAETQDSTHPLGSAMMRIDPSLPLLEEATYSLALAYLQGQDDALAEKVLQQMLARYQQRKTTRGYYLSRVWYQLARIRMREGKTNQALEFLATAEESAKGRILSTEEKLDLWLQRSECYRQLGQLDNAMLELSKVINDDAISGQRVQAMFLRATLYEQQGRPELAQKQLQATAKKGGPWALSAKEKLDRDYRYD